jgi:hypothetical protein
MSPALRPGDACVYLPLSGCWCMFPSDRVRYFWIWSCQMKKTIEFVEDYRGFTCLWRSSDPVYKDIIKRDDAQQYLAGKYGLQTRKAANNKIKVFFLLISGPTIYSNRSKSADDIRVKFLNRAPLANLTSSKTPKLTFRLIYPTHVPPPPPTFLVVTHNNYE